MLNHKYNQIINAKLVPFRKTPEKIKDYRWLLYGLLVIIFFIIF